MFAVVTKVELPADETIERGRKELETNVIPWSSRLRGSSRASSSRRRSGNEGLSVIVFQTKEQAEGAVQMQKIEAPLKLISNDIREVAASA